MTPSDVKIVAENINDFIEVPDGMNRLRQAVFTLAVSGRLIPQKRNEEVENVDDKSSLKEVPFDIPASWKWTTLSSVCTRITDGSHNPPKETLGGGYFMLSSKNIGNDFINTAGAREISKADFEQEDKRTDVNENDVLLTIVGSIGRCSVVGKDLPHRITLQRSVAVLKTNKEIDPNYLSLSLQAPNTYSYLNSEAKGTAQKGIYLNQLKSVPISLPPLPEQVRIVEKVRSVMKQLDELESRKNERDAVRSRLTRSAMLALGSANSKIAFDHLIELIKTSQDIKELENAILSLAITGQFTQSYSSTENPEMWEEKKLDDIAEITSSKRIYKNEYSSQGIPFYRISEISALADGRQIKDELFIDKKRFQEIQDRFGAPKVGDVLLTAVGTIGKIYIVREQDTFYFKDGNVLWFRNLNGVDPNFLRLVLAHAIEQMRNISNGAVYKALTIIKLKELKFMMPPLPEQKRIVKKVEELVKMLNSVRSIIDA